tara:strand:- start:38 stop:289 length:252 start_codon:yes stop_codon:yes gene_type:complete
VLALLTGITLVIIIFSYVIWSSRETLVKGRISWSGKDIPIKRKKKNKKELQLESTDKIGLLEQISNESKSFLSYEDKNNPSNN